MSSPKAVSDPSGAFSYTPMSAYSVAETVCCYPSVDESIIDSSTFTSPALYRNPDAQMGYRTDGRSILSDKERLLVDSFMVFFGGTESSIVALRNALPQTPKDWGYFVAGHQAGTLAGMGEGFESLFDDLKALWDALAAWYSFLTDEWIAIFALIDLWRGTLLGHESATLKRIEQHFPAFTEAMCQAAVLWRLGREELPKLVSAVEGDLMRLLSASGMALAALLGQETRDLVDDFVAGFVELRSNRHAQGVYIGRFYGRLAFELLLFLVPLAVTLIFPPGGAAAGGAVVAAKVVPGAARSARQATLAVRCARRIFKLWGQSFNAKYARILKNGGVEALDAAPELGMLEKVLHEAYLRVARKNAPYGKLNNETAQVNALWSRLLDLMGLPSTRTAFRLDAQHIFDNDFREKLKDEPDFKQAFQVLGWTDRDSMPAVALETEFHIRTGTEISKEMGWADIKPFPPLTALIKQHVGNLDQYETFEQLLNKLEAVYRWRGEFYSEEHKKTFVVDSPLWPHVEKTFVDIRKKLKLPNPTPKQ